MLHQHFKTPQGGGAIRSYYLAKALVDHGHRVVVITACNEKLRNSKEIDGIEVNYLPIPYHNRFAFYARAWSFIHYAVAASRAASSFGDFDRCYAISTPLTVGLSARWIKLRYRIPYFFEVGDLWPDVPIEMGIVKNYFLKRLLFALEKSIYHHADLIIALSPEIHSAIETKAPGTKVVWVPNMADCEFFTPEPKDPLLEDKYIVKEKFVISYMGAVGEANGLDYFLACAHAANKANLAVCFILCGDGAKLQELKASAATMGLSNFRFVNFVNRGGVKEIMNVTDAVFVCYKNIRILETGCPNKYFDGLACGKVIVVNFDGWIRKEIEDNGCGIFVDPLQAVDFVKKVSTLVSNPEGRKSFQRAARELAEKKYSRKILSESFSKLF